MHLLYPTETQPTGQSPVMYAVKDVDYFYFMHTTNLPLSELEIAEIDPDNKDLCRDLLTTQGKVDEQGRTKYYVVEDELYVNDGWEEYHYEQDYPY